MIRYIALLAVTLLLTVACSGGSETDTAQISTSAATAKPKPEHLLDFEDIENNIFDLDGNYLGH